jgi:hypothetical protein
MDTFLTFSVLRIFCHGLHCEDKSFEGWMSEIFGHVNVINICNEEP